MIDLENCEHKAIFFNEIEIIFQCLICGEDLVKFGSVEEYKLFCKFTGIDPQMLLRN